MAMSRNCCFVSMQRWRMVERKPWSVMRPGDMLPNRRSLRPICWTAKFMMPAWCRLKIKGRPGQPITIRYAEMLDDNGAFYTANLRGAMVTDRYFTRTADEEVYEPRFTYHGFRYVEVRGLTERPSENALVARVI